MTYSDKGIVQKISAFPVEVLGGVISEIKEK